MNFGPILRAMKHNRTRVVLIILEIAATLAIVTNCVNVIMAERGKMQQASGFDDDNLLWVRARPFTPDFRESAFVDTTVDADLRALAAIPGVRSAASTNFRVWEGGGSSTAVRPAGNAETQSQSTQIYYGTKDLIDTLGAKIIDGRAFRDGDHGVGTEPDPATVTVISKALADALFPGERAVGKSIQSVNGSGGAEGEPRTVIGVIEHFYNPYRYPGAPRQPLEERALLLPARVGSYQQGLRYLVRTEPGAVNSVVPEIEKRLAAVHSGRVFEFLTTPDKKARWFSGSQIMITTMLCIIIAVIVVTTLGLVGLTSLAVSERTKQIGTRRALGATRGDILSHFLVENWMITTAGLVLGVAGAYALNFLLVSNVSDVKLAWQLVAAGVVLLWVTSLLSTVPPAMRAMRIAPSIATRSV